MLSHKNWAKLENTREPSWEKRIREMIRLKRRRKLHFYDLFNFDKLFTRLLEFCYKSLMFMNHAALANPTLSFPTSK